MPEWYNCPMNKPATQSVEALLATLNDKQTIDDAQTLIEMMQGISRHEGEVVNAGTIGFDSYHYKYDSGREGDGFILGFYPRKGKTTIYMMDGTTRYATLLAKLGKHTITGYCVYIKQLKDIELSVLERILQQSYDNIKSLSQKGPIDHILWK